MLPDSEDDKAVFLALHYHFSHRVAKDLNHATNLYPADDFRTQSRQIEVLVASYTKCEKKTQNAAWHLHKPYIPCAQS